jgi:hypothetical protein
LGSAGEGGEAILIEDNGGVEGRLEVGDLTAELGDLLSEFLKLLGRVLAVEDAEDMLGVPVQSLTGQAVLLGSSGDLAVGSVEDGGGIGDAALGR